MPMIHKARCVTCIAVLIYTSGCATTKPLPPAVELRTVRVEVPVPQPCLHAEQIPAEPERIAPKLTGDARHDLDLVTAQAIRLQAWGRGMHAALIACAK
jgi:hypothetical protein